MATRLMELFAAVALVLSIVGIYGVIAHTLAQRTREIGIRGALGASSTRVLRMVIVESSTAVAVGLIGGIAIALVTAPLLGDLLFRTNPTDPATFVSTVAVIASAALAATCAPARLATRVDPIAILRQD